MFIRRTTTSASSSGKTYFTYRLVTSERVGKKVRQKTLLNLGRHFDLPREQWSQLCLRLDHILTGQTTLFDTDEAIEKSAQHIYSQLMASSAPQAKSPSRTAATDFQEVDVDSIEVIKSRSVGAQHVCLEALRELNLPAILDAAGFNTPQKAAALGNIVGRMCEPGSEGSTLAGMLEKLGAPEGALVVMDAGIASEKNITWLADKGYKYLVVSRHYRIELTFNNGAETASELNWYYEPSPISKQSHPGVYCLRSNQTDWDAETLWRTYTMLTDLESVFRSLKSELGLRPVYHHKEDRCDGHLFITTLAYQAVQAVRRRLKEQGINESWSLLREHFAVQHRVTATFKQKDGRTLHVRKATVAEEPLLKIYQILGLNTNPGGIKKMTM